MLNLSQLNEIQIVVFGLIMLRMTAFVFSAAVLSSPAIPVHAKVLLTLVLSMMIYGSVATNVTVARVASNESQLILLSFFEIAMGLCLGFLTRLFFFSIAMAGEMMSVSLGLGQAQMFNPMMGNNGNALEQFLVMFATLIFFGLNGHHFLIHGLVESFTTAPIGNINFNSSRLRDVVFVAQDIFVIAIRISAPVVISMLVIQVGIGLLSRAVPQINVLSTASSVTALLGMVLLLICLPLIASQMNGLLEETSINFFKFVKGI